MEAKAPASETAPSTIEESKVCHVTDTTTALCFSKCKALRTQKLLSLTCISVIIRMIQLQPNSGLHPTFSSLFSEDRFE